MDSNSNFIVALWEYTFRFWYDTFSNHAFPAHCSETISPFIWRCRPLQLPTHSRSILLGECEERRWKKKRKTVPPTLVVITMMGFISKACLHFSPTSWDRKQLRLVTNQRVKAWYIVPFSQGPFIHIVGTMDHEGIKKKKRKRRDIFVCLHS